MFRALLYLIIGLFLATFLRMVIGVLSKGLGQLFEPAASSGNPTGAGSKGPAGGELKRDPVCGTYVPVLTSISANIQGEVLYFCSTECRDRYKARS
jgi:YHS domain-containing protein